MADSGNMNQQSYISVPIITSSLVGILVFWSLKQILEKKNIENTAKILSENFERTHDLQIKELKEDIKALQGQIEAKIDIIEQKNVHINLINKEFHTLQKNYNRLKKESIFLKDQLHNAQLDIVEFEQENLSLVNQLNEALQHINSLDQIIESEKSTDQSASKIEEDFNVHDIGDTASITSPENFSELIAAESTNNTIHKKPNTGVALVGRQHLDEATTSDAINTTTRKINGAKHLPSKSHSSQNSTGVTNHLFKQQEFIPGEDFYGDKASVTESDKNNKRSSIVSAKESTKQAEFPNEPFDLEQPVEKKVVDNDAPEFANDLHSFPSNIIYDENIITNANPPSPMKYDIKSHHSKGHSKTESTFSHKSYKSGRSSKSAGSKVIVNPDNGSEIMVQGPTNLKRNKSNGKKSLFHFGNNKNHNNDLEYNAKETITANANADASSPDINADDDKFDDFKYKWVSELEYLRNTVKNMKGDALNKDFDQRSDHQQLQSRSTDSLHNNAIAKGKLVKQLDALKNQFHSDLNGTLYYDNEEFEEDLNDNGLLESANKKSNNSIVDEPEKETKKDDDDSDVLMVDHQKGVIYSKDYNTSSNLIPKFSKAGKFSFKRRSQEKNTLDRRVFSSVN